MSTILSFRFPLKNEVHKEEILSLIDQWVRTGEYYHFENSLISDEELASISRSHRRENQSELLHCQTGPTENGITYTAFRLETRDTSNLLWQAEVILEEISGEHAWLIVRQNRCPIVAGLPSDCSQRIKYPSLIKMLYDQGMIADDNDLPLNCPMPVNKLSQEEYQNLKYMYTWRTHSDFPLFYIYIGRNWSETPASLCAETLNESLRHLLAPEEQILSGIYWYDSVQLHRLLSIFARISHLYIGTCVEDDWIWKQLGAVSDNEHTATEPDNCKFSDLSNHDLSHSEMEEDPTAERIESSTAKEPEPRIEIIQPEANLHFRISLNAFPDFSELYRYLIMTYQFLMQTQPANFPNWDSISTLSLTRESNPANRTYYLPVSRQMANTIHRVRKEKEMTQEELAQKIGTTKMLISRLERMQTLKVKRNVITNIAEALGLEEGELL